MTTKSEDKKCENCKWWVITMGTWGTCHNDNLYFAIPNLGDNSETHRLFLCKYHEPKEVSNDN